MRSQSLRCCNLLKASRTALYDCQSGLIASVPDLKVHLRNHDYFMELSANIDPVRAMLTTDFAPVLAAGELPDISEHAEQLIIQGADVTAHRMFGPAPLVSTYVCIWDFVIGGISAQLSLDNVLMLARLGAVFDASLDDIDNPRAAMLALEPVTDMTFLSARIAPIDITILGRDRSALQVVVPEEVMVRLDDRPCDSYLKHLEVDVPTIDVRALRPVSSTSDRFVAVARLEADMVLSLASTATDWEARKEKQIAFVRQEDRETKRCLFLYSDEKDSDVPTRLDSPLQTPKLLRHRGAHSFLALDTAWT